jgi:hypothetical protein
MTSAAWERMQVATAALQNIGDSARSASKQFKNLSRALEQSRKSQQK